MICSDLGCVVVTFNRLDKLKKALQAYEVATVLPLYIIVVDNNSTDGTQEYLDSWEKNQTETQKIVIHLPENIGGAGGFYTGMKKAMQLPAEWIWVADDDACPEQDAFKRIADRIEQGTDGIAAFCTSVIENGKVALDARQNIWRNGLVLNHKGISVTNYTKDEFELGIFSYVGTVLSKTVLQRVGLTRKDYFIHYDDAEHSLRVAQVGKILCVPAAKVIHYPVSSANSKPDWRYYYNVRNWYDLEKRHYFLVYCWHMLRDTIDIWAHLLTGRKVKKYNVVWTALKDAMFGRMGMHKIYRPGWKPDFDN